MNIRDTKTAYKINSPFCGRDKNGRFKCVCGKCTQVDSAKRGDSRNDSSNGRNN